MWFRLPPFSVTVGRSEVVQRFVESSNKRQALRCEYGYWIKCIEDARRDSAAFVAWRELASAANRSRPGAMAERVRLAIKTFLDASISETQLGEGRSADLMDSLMNAIASSVRSCHCSSRCKLEEPLRI